jgi:hypothetical protein
VQYLIHCCDHATLAVLSSTVFSTAFELRGADLPFFHAGKKFEEKQISWKKIFW